jgi:hypothetical protein
VSKEQLARAWRDAGLSLVQDGTGMDELRELLNHPDAPDVREACAAWKFISDTWRHGGAPNMGDAPRLMIRHFDIVQLRVRGDFDPVAMARPPRAGPRRQDNTRGQLPVVDFGSFRKEAPP